MINQDSPSQDSNSSSLNHSDHLFLHPADHPGLLLVSKPFNGSNFGSWKKSMSIALSAKIKLIFINSNTQPNITDFKYGQWKRCNDMVTSWILNVLSQEIAESVLYSDSAYNIWKELEDRYGQASGAKLFQLEKEIRLSGQGTNDIAGYFTKLKKNWDELNILSSLPICSCGSAQAMQKFNEDQRLIQFLMGLNSDYNHIRGNILMMKPLPSVSQAYALLSQEEKQREVQAASEFINESASMYASNHNQNQQQRIQYDQNYKQKLDGKRTVCNHCKKPGHIASKCYRLVGFPKDFKFTKNKRFAGNSMSNQDDDPSQPGEHYLHNNNQDRNSCKLKSQNDLQTRNYDNNHQNISQAQFNQLMAMMNNLQTSNKLTDHFEGSSCQAFTASNCSGIKACFPHVSSGDCVGCCCWSATDCTWIIDTGASDHMCHNEKLFIQTQILPKAHHVTLPNGHVVNVHKVGSVHIHPNITLHNVLYIPQFKYNLLSIGKLCKEPFSYAFFTNSKCYFQGPSMKRPLHLGDIHSGLYLLQHSPASQAQTHYESSTSDANICHKDHAQSNSIF
ncbi:uncharacterized protein LOC130818430 [Amaranthus tricolor]|uniref:uncharacterized protein LOC130818430 n=1 Tax=Amaranthus tricolor TaxID=29722 RepID=UPI0025834ED8|nr:uncharacterized protein LOC130818430 [Amaranthus tricolor]